MLTAMAQSKTKDNCEDLEPCAGQRAIKCGKNMSEHLELIFRKCNDRVHD